jgi:hypothetical protein
VVVVAARAPHQPTLRPAASALQSVPTKEFNPQLPGFPQGGLSYLTSPPTAPPKPGGLVEALRRQLQDDCPQCAWWPAGDAAAQIAKETWAFAPKWFAGTVREAGLFGTWTPLAGPPKGVRGCCWSLTGTHSSLERAQCFAHRPVATGHCARLPYDVPVYE